jgi:lactoylglutathione lyase
MMPCSLGSESQPRWIGVGEAGPYHREEVARAAGVIRDGIPGYRRPPSCHQERFPVRLNYAIVFVSNMKRSVSFYRDVLGLPLRFESPGWTEFATDGATLALHASERSEPESEDPLRVPAGRCRPGLSVPDLNEFHKRMVERNVPCIQEPKETFGVRIAQYLDPDGLAISVSEERRGSYREGLGSAKVDIQPGFEKPDGRVG